MVYRADSFAADRVVSDITAKGGLAVAVQADVSSEVDVKRIFATVDSAFGGAPLKALINNAGTLGPLCPLADATAEKLSEVMYTNGEHSCDPHQLQSARDSKVGASMRCHRVECGSSELRASMLAVAAFGDTFATMEAPLAPYVSSCGADALLP